MIIWTVLPFEQVLAGFDDNTYPEHETGEVAGVPVLLENMHDGHKRVIKINSSNPFHFLNPAVYPGLLV